MLLYNVSFQKWAARTPEDKKSREDRKKLVQSLFRSRMGLHVDKPRQGSGNSNDGNTARRFFENYYCSSVLPLGHLSEDAQESRNKDYTRFTLHHARKCSRVATNEDVLHTLLYTSDPYITSLRKPSNKKSYLKLNNQKTRVCLKMFLGTLGIKEWTVRYRLGEKPNKQTIINRKENPALPK